MEERKEPAMSIGIKHVPRKVGRHEVTAALANILHNPPFEQPKGRLLNFNVVLMCKDGGALGHHDGYGKLQVPTRKIGKQLLKVLEQKPIRLGGSKIHFYHSQQKDRVSDKDTVILQKAPFVDSALEKDREEKIYALETGLGLRVDTVQFGVLFGNPLPGQPREYSIEWEKSYSKEGQAWLRFEYDHKLLRIEVGNSLSEDTGTKIVIDFAMISKIAVGYDSGKAFMIFDTYTPPSFEEVDFYPCVTGDDRRDKRKARDRRRIGSVERHQGHARVAPYAHTLRLVLPIEDTDGSDVIDNFERKCKIAELKVTVIRANVEAAGYKFFSESNMRKWNRYMSQSEWPVAFQLESLLHNGLLNLDVLLRMQPQFDAFCGQHGSQSLADLLLQFNVALNDPKRPHFKDRSRPSREFPEECFERLAQKYVVKQKSSSQGFSCYHVIVSPTRLWLEGPYASDSNRIIRNYTGYEDHFIRVAFCDENRLPLRWNLDFEEEDELEGDSNIDGDAFLKERIAQILRGFTLAGRNFEFLAYSNSSLREHSLWFMRPFTYNGSLVTSEKIRTSIGDFHLSPEEPTDMEHPQLLRCPSKWAARIAQAFTATESSVKIHRSEWEVIPDLGREPYLFTDGVGTISQGLADEIWEMLCAARPSRRERAVKPSAYQIRFLGFKGVVVVDQELDRKPESKIRMRLRPSMRKFENSSAIVADIEIAESFEVPMAAHLNKALVMILEDRGVPADVFLSLLRDAVADAQLVDDSLESCRNFLAKNSFWNGFHLPGIFEQLEKRGAIISHSNRPSKGKKRVNIDSAFFKGLRSVARIQILREIKHDARIPIPKSYLLVGVADEGPGYVNDPSRPEFLFDNTDCLKENQIFACVQYPGDAEPTYLEGGCLIWRSPLTHLGDVQRVHAIGKPPPRSLFGHLKNVVVMPSQGRRSLASCLGGGDYDGDTFTVSTLDTIKPTLGAVAASYEAGQDRCIERNCTVEDIHEFIVEYFHSDVIGLLSKRLWVIADQSESGFHDPACEKLAALCSQAVDYPKKGIPVDISGRNLPRTIIRQKPDWDAAEVINPHKSDYYESTRALGQMYRDIKATDIVLPNNDPGQSANPLEFSTASITSLLQDEVYQYLPSFDECRRDHDIETLFLSYVENLRYISAIHTLSNDASVRLTEQEVVLGTILAHCSERRFRKERTYRMRTHAGTLVKDIQQGFRPINGTDQVDDRECLLHVLEKAWYAWISRRENEFGVNSFRLIALGSVLDSLTKLETLPPTN